MGWGSRFMAALGSETSGQWWRHAAHYMLWGAEKGAKEFEGGWALEFDKWLPPPTFSSSYSCFHRVPSQMKGLLEKICLFGRQGGTEEVDKAYSLDWSFYMGALKEKNECRTWIMLKFAIFLQVIHEKQFLFNRARCHRFKIFFFFLNSLPFFQTRNFA